jgi:hypothetical protein
MTLPSDFSALIAIAQADELDGIKRQILDRLEEIGMAPGRNLLIALAARRRALAEERRKLQELWDATPAAPDDAANGEDGEEVTHGG